MQYLRSGCIVPFIAYCMTNPNIAGTAYTDASLGKMSYGNQNIPARKRHQTAPHIILNIFKDLPLLFISKY